LVFRGKNSVYTHFSGGEISVYTHFSGEKNEYGGKNEYVTPVLLKNNFWDPTGK
jgi:hypothetical protein